MVELCDSLHHSVPRPIGIHRHVTRYPVIYTDFPVHNSRRGRLEINFDFYFVYSIRRDLIQEVTSSLMVEASLSTE